MAKSKIEWTEQTWNFLIGCDKVSTGCKNCYAITQANIRMHNPNAKMQKKFANTVKKENGKLNWTGHINFDEETLLKPLSNKTPTTYFVNSLSDLFHENAKDEWIDKAFAVMALTPQHTYQILTKRPERMREYLLSKVGLESREETIMREAAFLGNIIWDSRGNRKELYRNSKNIENRRSWVGFSLPNVWLGVSVENQKAADERIPLLLDTPAKVRFLSCEPLLEEVNLVDPIMKNSSEFLDGRDGEGCDFSDLMECAEWDYLGHKYIPKYESALEMSFCEKCSNREANPMHNNRSFRHLSTENQYIDWIIVGGESGHGARPCDIAWIRSIVQQCKDAGVSVFVKQLGAKPFVKDTSWRAKDADYRREYLKLKNKKGGDISEFPEDLRIREMPKIG